MSSIEGSPGFHHPYTYDLLSPSHRHNELHSVLHLTRHGVIRQLFLFSPINCIEGTVTCCWVLRPLGMQIRETFRLHFSVVTVLLCLGPSARQASVTREIHCPSSVLCFVCKDGSLHCARPRHQDLTRLLGSWVMRSAQVVLLPLENQKVSHQVVSTCAQGIPIFYSDLFNSHRVYVEHGVRF